MSDRTAGGTRPVHHDRRRSALILVDLQPGDWDLTRPVDPASDSAVRADLVRAGVELATSSRVRR